MAIAMFALASLVLVQSLALDKEAEVIIEPARQPVRPDRVWGTPGQMPGGTSWHFGDCSHIGRTVHQVTSLTASQVPPPGVQLNR